MFSIPFPWNNQMHSDQMVKGPITHLKDILYELENTQNICNGPQKKRSGCFLGKVFMHWFLELNNLLLYIGADPVKVIHSYEGQKPELLFLFLLSATVRCNRLLYYAYQNHLNSRRLQRFLSLLQKQDEIMIRFKMEIETLSQRCCNT